MAALDPSIILGLKTPQFVQPQELYAAQGQIQQNELANRLGGLKLQEFEQGVQNKNALAEAYRGATGPDGQINRNALYGGLAKAGQGAAIPGIQKNFADSDKAGVDSEKSKLEAALKKFEVAGQIMSGVSDQATWDRARAQTAQVFGQEAAAQMPAQYDPALVQEKQNQALTVKDQLEQKWKAMSYTTPDANARLSADTSRANNQASVGASYANAAATRSVGQANKEAAQINAGYGREQDLRKEFEALPEVKNYKQALPAFTGIKDAITRNTPQSDINIVYGIAKLYDPTSVVREGEYATVANSPNIPDKIKGYANYLAGGGRLTEKVKQEIFAEAKGRMQSFENQYSGARGDFESIASRSGSDPTRIFPRPAAPVVQSVSKTVDFGDLK